ncbi:MAG: hypothetical protein IKC73_05890 [Clostridia bacterium]|nr:hypothetical protein [Clostridia bacterium]
MEPKNYTLVRTEGEYAILRDDATGDEVFIALSLLPPSADIGTRLHYEMFSYEIIE